MKSQWLSFAVLAWWCGGNQSFAVFYGDINLSNYDSNNPVFYLGSTTRLPVSGSFVQVLGGPVGGPLVVLQASTGLEIFTLFEPGFFDGGFGNVSGVPEYELGQFQIRAWRKAPTFDSAIEKGESALFIERVGNNAAVAFPAPPNPGAMFNAPSFVVQIPEPGSVTLIFLGAVALLHRPHARSLLLN